MADESEVKEAIEGAQKVNKIVPVPGDIIEFNSKSVFAGCVAQVMNERPDVRDALVFKLIRKSDYVIALSEAFENFTSGQSLLENMRFVAKSIEEYDALKAQEAAEEAKALLDKEAKEKAKAEKKAAKANVDGGQE